GWSLDSAARVPCARPGYPVRPVGHRCVTAARGAGPGLPRCGAPSSPPPRTPAVHPLRRPAAHSLRGPVAHSLRGPVAHSLRGPAAHSLRGPVAPSSRANSAHTCLPPLTGSVPRESDTASNGTLPRPPVAPQPTLAGLP